MGRSRLARMDLNIKDNLSDPSSLYVRAQHGPTFRWWPIPCLDPIKDEEKEEDDGVISYWSGDDGNWCWYRILSALDLGARPWKIQKYYFLSMGLQEYLEWCGTTCSDTGALKVPLSAKMTKMAIVNPGLTESRTRSKSSQTFFLMVLNQTQASQKFLETLTKFDPELTLGGP